MKAPEKIYVKITHPISDEYTEMIAFEDGDGIEYIRTDAFIEKACAFLETYPHMFFGVLRSDMIDDFKDYMKGE